jgi:hypothetical protein
MSTVGSNDLKRDLPGAGESTAINRRADIGRMLVADSLLGWVTFTFTRYFPGAEAPGY